MAWPIDLPATGDKPGRSSGARGEKGLLRNAGSCRLLPVSRERERAGVGTFLGARPRGQRGAEQQQQCDPQGPAPLHGAGRDLGPRPLRLGQVARDWAIRAGTAGAEGGAR